MRVRFVSIFSMEKMMKFDDELIRTVHRSLKFEYREDKLLCSSCVCLFVVMKQKLKGFMKI